MATRNQRATGWKETGRQKDDYYSTPRWAVEALLDREIFESPVWECASGDGAISKVLEERGYTVISSDLRQDETVYGEKGVNFLFETKKVKSIITNPPFKSGLNFVLHALECADKIAIFGRIQFLESFERYEKLFSKHSPARVYVFSGRCSCLKNGEPVNAGILCFAWFVWEKGFTGKPVLDWIVPKKKALLLVEEAKTK